MTDSDSADDADDRAPLALSDISTTWRRVHNPARFFMTYGDAARAYLTAILHDEGEAEEVLQQVLLQVVEKGFTTYQPDPTRKTFRYYLKAVLRNAAARHRRPSRLPVGDTDPDALGDEPAGDEAMRAEWRAAVLDAALRELDRHERAAKRGNLAHTVVQLSLDNEQQDGHKLGSRELAKLASEKSGQPLTETAFRKQLERARRTFAELIVAEVRQSLDGASDDEVLDELADLRLLQFVRDYLPD